MPSRAEAGKHQPGLFGEENRLVSGLALKPDFISREEEISLFESIAVLPFRQAKYKAYLANRRVVRFGNATYPENLEFDEDPADGGNPCRALPGFLLALRKRAADWINVRPADFEHVLVSEYQPGVPIGWHRDAPHFDCVVGISLGGGARLRFKPFGGSGKKDIFSVELAPRSAYIMRGPIRWNWQHSIPPHKALRYSVTLRTLCACPGLPS